MQPLVRLGRLRGRYPILDLSYRASGITHCLIRLWHVMLALMASYRSSKRLQLRRSLLTRFAVRQYSHAI